MRRLFSAMLLLLCAASSATAQDAAQDLQLFIHNPNSGDDLNFVGTYEFPFPPGTAIGGNSSVIFRLVNTSATYAYWVQLINFSLGSAFATQTPPSPCPAATPCSPPTPVYAQCLAPAGNSAASNNEDFTVVFSPPNVSAWAPLTAYAIFSIVNYEGSPYLCRAPRDNTSSAPPPSDAAHFQSIGEGFTNVSYPPSVAAWAPLTAYSANSIVSYAGSPYLCIIARDDTSSDPPPADTAHFQPFSSTSPVASTNEGFTVALSAPGASPVTETYQDNLQIASAPFPASQGCASPPNMTQVPFAAFSGTGVPGSISSGSTPGAFTLSYTDAAGVSYPLSAGATANFGNVQIGSTESFWFTLSNPAASAASVPQISVSSGAYQILNALPTPDSIQAGGAASFQVAFAPTQSSTPTFTDTLSIGSQSINLTGVGTEPVFPTPTLNVTTGAVENQQQDYISVILPSPAPYQATDYLILSFTPSVTGVTTDPAVLFLQGNLSAVPVDFEQGAESGTVNNQTAIGFQTGTTAGTLTFTLCTMAATPCSAANTLATQSYTIAPQVVQIASATAVSNDPSLVITLTGYDNTYSTGQLTFTFYDSNGNSLTPGGMSVNATSQFSQYFFAGQGYGGAFSMQASFPVSGTITQTVQGTNSTTWAGAEVYSVTVTLQNAAGTSLPQTILFQ